MRRSISKQKGVTLLEMMITVAILAIVLTVVAPNVQGILIKNRAVATMNELSTVIQYARNSAIDEQANAVFCPSSDFTSCSTNWRHPKMVFIDQNNDGERDANEVLLVATESLNSTMTFTSTSDVISFEDSGASSAQTIIKLCHTSNNAQYARQIEISLQGRVRLSQDTDKNGVHEDTDGNPLSC
ncbi:GspH/FimT family pseudopilin [Glaciecola sp. KUL10]|uniref:GspH/FimT family pseudopilin n=1 Tax=Glaciecola sp. (strain KUL10) TaxID=2161813 RepID=UPI000D9970A4|nr:GspH/FimT family pseudopilin [Glaciecola sp. KUL10]GBL04702.1 type IV fimbrial biogenesis protein FimT [Glaciecola sp. KUL10]